MASCRSTTTAWWVWSDLHLGDVDALDFFGRPFGSVDEMDDVILEHWQAQVGPDDLVVCLGDIARANLTASLRRLRGLPGRKVLAFGNHDRSARGFDEVCGSLYAHGDPPLLSTHVPLRRVPPGCVNVHGHLTLRACAARGARQRQRRAARLPSQAADGHPTLGGGPRHREDRARPNDCPLPGAAPVIVAPGRSWDRFRGGGGRWRPSRTVTGERIGRLDEPEMVRLERALLVFFGLA